MWKIFLQNDAAFSILSLKRLLHIHLEFAVEAAGKECAVLEWEARFCLESLFSQVLLCGPLRERSECSRELQLIEPLEEEKSKEHSR